MLCPQLTSEKHLPVWTLAARFTGQPSVTQHMPSWAAGVWKPLRCLVKTELAQPEGTWEGVCLKRPPAALRTWREQTSFCRRGLNAETYRGPQLCGTLKE